MAQAFESFRIEHVYRERNAEADALANDSDIDGDGISITQVFPSTAHGTLLGNLDGSLENITIGESGHRLSWHYKDQWRAYYGATSFPMQFDKVEAKQTLVVNPR